MTLTARSVRRRFVTLRVTRWLPTGLLIPVLVLYLVDRGLSLAEIGVAAAAQGIVVMVLELPTGGFADSFGRRRVLLLANGFDVVTLVLFMAGRSLAWFIVAWACQGVFRALESGPLEAWFVDALEGCGEEEDVERGLRLGGVAIGLSIAAGALLSGLLVVIAGSIGPADPLVVPFGAALLIRLADSGLVWRLMTEIRPPAGLQTLRRAIDDVPRVVVGSMRLVRRSTVLALLIGVELTWGFGMVAFETLFPVRLADLLGSADRAGAAMGPVSAGAWGASALGAAGVGWFSHRFGQFPTAAAMRVVQAVTVLVMGVAIGPAGAIAAYLGCYAIHGAANPIHAALLHREADASNRATVLSLNSLMAAASGALGGIVLGVVADSHGTTSGLATGAVVLAAGAPLYLWAGRLRREAVPAD